MYTDDFLEKPHRRLNILTGEWTLVSPHRTKRPWSGLEEKPDTNSPPEYVSDCYLCPGNKRADGEVNPNYDSTFVFTNDFSALLPLEDGSKDGVPENTETDDLLVAEPEGGICKVICYSPRHDLAIARMEPQQVEGVITTWQREYLDLGANADINYVQIFENRGLVMGCSNPHPHGQVWSNSTIPTIPASESEQQKKYQERTGGCLLCSYLEKEIKQDERILFGNSSFVALVPFWAVWPYETMILPRRHASSIDDMNDNERADLAELMIRLGICYDNLFLTSFPYSMGIHQKPTDGGDHDCWHYHFHYLPPLLRSQSIRKHMVGYELMAMSQRDLTAERVAKTLRALPSTHYLDGESA